MASSRLRSAERVIDANAVTALFAIEATIHAVDVSTSRGVVFAGIGHGDLGNALVFAAFLVFGATQQALWSMTDHSPGHDTRVLGGCFGKAFAYNAFLALVAAGVAMMVFAEVLSRTTSYRGEIRIYSPER